MKVEEIITESMSELSHILHDVGESSATADFDMNSETVYLNFMLYNVPGSMQLQPLPETKFRSRLYAAALAMTKGVKPESWKAVERLVKGRISPQAVKILINPLAWKITKFRYDGLRF